MSSATCSSRLRSGEVPVSADDTEDLEVHRVSIEAFEQLIRSGAMWDGMTLAAYAMWRARDQKR